MKINDGRSVCYFALPVLLLATCVLQPTKATAQATAGVDCSQINVPLLMMEDNMRAGKILVECGIMKGGQPGAGRQSEPPATPPNVRVSNGSDCNSSSDVCGSESMSAGSIADKGQTIVVNYNANYEQANYSGTSVSTDGGKTFTEIQPAPFANGHSENIGDPLVVYNNKLGMFFAGDLATGCGGQGIGLWTSTDGQNWTTGSCPHNGSSDDRPSMWADNNARSATYGRMYISFNNFAVGNAALSVVYSDDGVTWTGPVIVSNTNTFIRDVQITGSPRGAALPQGQKNSTVFLAGMDEGGGGNATRQNYMYVSTDGGATWATVAMGPRFNPPGDSSCGYFYQVNPIIRHMGWGQPAVGPNGVVHYDFAGQGTNGDNGDIFYTRSTDNGTTWSTPIKLNTDKDAQYKEQWMPSLTATSGGLVTASWYDRRKATTACNSVGDAGCNYERVGRQSKTNGKSWLADITISTGIITQPAQDDPDVVGCYAGDYDYGQDLNNADTGSVAATYVTWTDGRFSIGGVPVQSVDFAKVPAPPK